MEKTQWISVKERLPEKGRWILIFCWRGIIQASFWGNYWQMQELNAYGQKFTMEEVTHWMPLPEPPTSEPNLL